MARRRSKHTRPHRPLGSIADTRREGKRDGAWLVRPVRSADKVYRCPGCQQTVAVGTPHLVAWPEQLAPGVPTGPEERRHWHTACWRARS